MAAEFAPMPDAEPRLGSAVVRRWVLEDLEYDLKLCVVKYNEGSVRHVIRPYCRGQRANEPMHVSLDTGDVSGSRSTWGDEPGGSRGIPRRHVRQSPSIEY